MLTAAGYRVDRAATSVTGVVDRRPVSRFLPSSMAIKSCRDALEPAFDEYVSTVSSPEMAASLSTVALLTATCSSIDARRVLDAGSGFSTYALARWRRRCCHIGR